MYSLLCPDPNRIEHVDEVGTAVEKAMTCAYGVWPGLRNGASSRRSNHGMRVCDHSGWRSSSNWTPSGGNCGDNGAGSCITTCSPRLAMRFGVVGSLCCSGVAGSLMSGHAVSITCVLVLVSFARHVPACDASCDMLSFSKRNSLTGISRMNI